MIRAMGKNLPPRVFTKHGRYYLVTAEGARRVWRPLTRVAEISKPMFVVTGGNDPRVPASEADQIVKAIRDKGGVAWHLLGKNEGHGFAKKENVDYQFWATLMFWKQNLLN